MKVELSQSEKSYLTGVKRRIDKNLKGEHFDLRKVQSQQREWKNFKLKIAKEAIALLTEINRIKKEYTVIDISDLTMGYQENDKQYFFDFYGSNGSVRFVFDRGINDVIMFNYVKEDIYEESISLF